MNPNNTTKPKFDLFKNFEHLRNVPKVADLRKNGYKVAVAHKRNYLFTYQNGLQEVTPMTLNEVKAVKNMFPENIASVSPLSSGGSTFVHIYKEGKEYHGVSICSNQDNFCKRLGVALAIKRSGLV